MEKNNVSMKTVVETFIVEETQELIHDNDKLEQWNGLVSELGLKGQEKIVVVDKSPIPYLYMNQGLINAFRILCPKDVKVEAYDKSPIPVEILSLVSMSIKEHHFYKIEIWYNEADIDPVCVGVCKGENYKESYESWNKNMYNYYLIGRWADVKMSLDQIVAKAKALFVISKKSQYEQDIRDAKRKLEDLEMEAIKSFGNAMPTTDNLPF